MGSKHILICLLSCGILTFPLLSVQSHAGSCPAEGLVKSAAIAFRNAGSAQSFANATSRFADMRSLSLFALGPYRSKLPKANEGKFIGLSKAFIGKFMAQNASRISGSKFIITSCTSSTVSARFDGGSSLVFRVNGTNRITDVSVAGYSIANAMRSKFTSIISSNGGDVGALISYLAK